MQPVDHERRGELGGSGVERPRGGAIADESRQQAGEAPQGLVVGQAGVAEQGMVQVDLRGVEVRNGGDQLIEAFGVGAGTGQHGLRAGDQ